MGVAAGRAGPGRYASGREARLAVRNGAHRGPTSGIAPGYVQGNLAILPQAVIAAMRPALCITHAPGHMLVTDLKNSRLAIL